MTPLTLPRLLASVLTCLLLLAHPAVAGTPEDALARAGELAARKEQGKAIETLQGAVAAYPYRLDLRRALAEHWFGLGLAELEARRFVEAARAFADGLDYTDDEGRFRLMRGYALYRAGDLGGAEVELGAARTATGDEPQVLELLGEVYYAGGRLHEALRIWEEALEKRPDDAELAARLEKVRRELRVEESMSRSSGGNFTISYDGAAHGELGDQVLEVLGTAYNDVGRELGIYPDVQIPVLLYARREFSELTGAPDWSGGLYDGKIRIPVGGLRAMNDRLRAVLYHEYTHVAVRFLTRGRCPVWLNEGLAEVAGRRHFDPQLQSLPEAVAAGRLLPFDRLERSFAGLPPSDVALAYEQSYSLVAFFIDEFGWHKMGELLTAAAEGLSAAESVGRALADYGVGYEELLARWRAQVGVRS